MATTKRNKVTACILQKKYDNSGRLEVGVDEAGRGPMLGRVYSAAVILPEDDFKHEDMKDSKRFHSEKKIREVAEYIKENAIAWNVSYSTEQEIDEVNIRNATHNAMHRAIKGIVSPDNLNHHLLIDGNDFRKLIFYEDDEGIIIVPHVCIEG